MKIRKKNFILLSGIMFILLVSVAYSVKILGFEELRFDGALIINSTTLSIKTNDIVRMFVDSTGLVGIGTSAPGAALDIGGGTGGLADGADDVLIAGDLEVDDDVRIDGGAITLSADTAVTLSGGVDGINFDSNTLSIDATNNRVGIGDAAPYNDLTVVGSVGVSGSLNASSINTTGNAYFATSSGNVGIGATNPAHKLTVDGTFNITGNITLDGNINISTDSRDLIIDTGSEETIFGDGTGKIDAGTVDPIYTIDGARYATYAPWMTGQKEETTGKVQISNGRAAIDFGNAGQGSDLWLFSKVTDFGEDMGYLSVLLTPSFNGNIPKVAYEMEPINNRIIIHSEADVEVSYRLTAPRFDHEEWKNVLEDDGPSGFVITS